MKRNYRKFWLIPLIFILLTAYAYADTEYVPTNDEAITVSNTAIGFTASKMVPTSGAFKNHQADAALVTVETNNIRFRDAGTPTASVGHLLQPGQSVFLESGSQLINFLAIRVTNDATIYVTYYHKKNF